MTSDRLPGGAEHHRTPELDPKTVAEAEKNIAINPATDPQDYLNGEASQLEEQDNSTELNQKSTS